VFLLTKTPVTCGHRIVGGSTEARSPSGPGYAAQCAQLLRTLLLAVGAAVSAIGSERVGAASARRRNTMNGSLLVSVIVALSRRRLGAVFTEKILRALTQEEEVIRSRSASIKVFAGSELVFSVSTTLDRGDSADRTCARRSMVRGDRGRAPEIRADFLLILRRARARRAKGLTGAELPPRTLIAASHALVGSVLAAGQKAAKQR